MILKILCKKYDIFCQIVLTYARIYGIIYVSNEKQEEKKHEKHIFWKR